MAKLKTGRHTSALKETRKNVKRNIQNTTVRSSIRTLAAKLKEAVTKKDKVAAEKLLVSAYTAWDKAAKRNIIHKNAASNQKSSLAKLVKSIA